MSSHFNLGLNTGGFGGHAPPPAFSLLGNSHYQPSFHLAPTFNPATFVCPTYVPQMPTAPIFSLPEFPAQPGVSLFTGTAKVLLTSEPFSFEIPKSVKSAGLAFSAFKTASKLTEGVDKALDRGESTAEAYVCQTAKILTKEFSGKALAGFVIGGIPPYLAAAVASPPLAATVPFVLPQIPAAYQMAQGTAAVLGQGAEALCHSGFEAARKLTRKGE